jgi:hypothetical protein
MAVERSHIKISSRVTPRNSPAALWLLLRAGLGGEAAALASAPQQMTAAAVMTFPRVEAEERNQPLLPKAFAFHSVNM